MRTVPREGLVPNQQGVWRRDGIRQKEEVLVLAEEKLHIYHFQNQQRPFRCIRELLSTSGFHLEGVPGQEGRLSQEEQPSPLQFADPLT